MCRLPVPIPARVLLPHFPWAITITAVILGPVALGKETVTVTVNVRVI